MTDEVQRTAAHWDEFIENYAGKRTGLFWLEIPEVIRGINRRISGDPDLDWATYTVRKRFSARLPMTRCLSLGAGAGQLERDLARQRVFLECDAYDISPGAVEKATKLASEAGFDNIHYRVADIYQIEKVLIDCGEMKSDFAYLVATPKTRQ